MKDDFGRDSGHWNPPSLALKGFVGISLLRPRLLQNLCCCALFAKPLCKATHAVNHHGFHRGYLSSCITSTGLLDNGVIHARNPLRAHQPPNQPEHDCSGQWTVFKPNGITKAIVPHAALCQLIRSEALAATKQCGGIKSHLREQVACPEAQAHHTHAECGHHAAPIEPVWINIQTPCK